MCNVLIIPEAGLTGKESQRSSRLPGLCRAVSVVVAVLGTSCGLFSLMTTALVANRTERITAKGFHSEKFCFQRNNKIPLLKFFPNERHVTIPWLA